jgi:glycosyltransferase involved in cell wall biosynthesis
MTQPTARTPRPRPDVSILVTLYNERDNVDELLTRIQDTCSRIGGSYEVVLVDDGSSDGTREKLLQWAGRHDDIKVIVLSRNFGQHAACAAGMRRARGRIVIWMDGDLQDPPEEIPAFLEKISTGCDIVYGVRVDRTDSAVRVYGANVFFGLFRALAGYGLPENASTYRAMTRNVVRAFNRMGEHSRFTAGMIAWLGFSIGTVPVPHHARHAGRTNYNLARLLQLSFDGIFSSTAQPLRLASLTGVCLALVSFMAGMYVVYRWVRFGFVVTGYASTMISLFFLSGIILLGLGIVGEYLARVFADVQNRPLYVVRETRNLERGGRARALHG